MSSSTAQTLKPLTEQEAETSKLVVGFIGRSTIFFIIAVQNAFSWHAGIIYRIAGYLFPRWRGAIMTIHSIFVLLMMPANQRMIKITALAARGYLPWEKAVFEWLWDGSSILLWSVVTWAVYKYAASISIISMPLLLFEVIIARIGLSIFIGVCISALTIAYPGIWVGAFLRFFQLYGTMFEAFSHSWFFPILTRLCYVHDGFLIKNYDRFLLRSGVVPSSQQSLERLVVGLNDYRYDGLEDRQFRLLKITRSWTMSPFECSLVVFDMHDAELPAYTAVSYEWGPNSEMKPFNVLIGDKQLAVTDSAYQVVRGLAPRSGELYIWCDFICINQNDRDERASQVRMMREIYASASKVTLYLNTASAVNYDECDLAAYHLQKITKSLQQPQWNMNRQWARFNKVKLGERGSLGWLAMARIFQRQYWKRAWVVQEIVLAKELVVIFGDNEFSWDELVHLVEAFQDRGNDGSLDVTGATLSGVEIPFAQIMSLLLISRIRDQFHRYGGFDFRQIMSYGPKFDATDPRDNVFAFQGLCSESIPLSLQPDYRIRPVDLFIDSVREILTEGLWFLNFAGIGWGERSLESRLASVADEELPSWAPNWGLTVNKNLLPPLYTPSYLEELRATLHEETRTLSVHSATFDSIVKVTDFPLLPGFESGFSAGHLSIEALPRMARAVKGLQADMETLVPVSYPTGIERDDALWRVLLGNKQRTREEIEYYNNSLALWTSQITFGSHAMGLVDSDEAVSKADNGEANKIEDLLVKTIAAIDRINEPTGDSTAQRSPEESLAAGISASQLETMYRNSTQFSYELAQHSVGRKVAFTRGGHIILAPQLAAAGDEVHFIAGAETPFVLRPIDNQEQEKVEYRLVGDCELYNAQEELEKLGEFRKLAIV